MEPLSASSLLFPLVCLTSASIVRARWRGSEVVLVACATALIAGFAARHLAAGLDLALMAEGVWVGSAVFFAGSAGVSLGLLKTADIAPLAAASVWYVPDGLLWFLGTFLMGTAILAFGPAIAPAEAGQARGGLSEDPGYLRIAALPLAAWVATCAVYIDEIRAAI